MFATACYGKRKRDGRSTAFFGYAVGLARYFIQRDGEYAVRSVADVSNGGNGNYVELADR